MNRQVDFYKRIQQQNGFMKLLDKRKNDKGFTLIELLIVITIIGILAGIAIPVFSSYRNMSYDTTAKEDLRNVINFLELYFLDAGTFPNTTAELLAAGFNLSKDVSFTSYSVNGDPTVHMHIQHASSPNEWHANYPKEGVEIEIR
jgi:prepilin-type N-terminal cleavage/methylation domain-containing protein